MSIQIGKAALGTADRIAFFRTLSSWLSSGGGHTSVAEAIQNTCDSFSVDEYAALRGRMDLIVREYAGGQVKFVDALRMAQIGFVSNELKIIEAAEKSNQLRDALPSLVTALDIQYQGRKKLLGSMAMPLVIGFMLIAMSLGVLLFMLPMVIGPVIRRNPDAVEDFPFILQQYWYASVWLQSNYMIPVVLLCIPIVMLLLRNVEPVKTWLSNLLLWFKPTRRLVLGFNSVIAVYFMPALVRSGMPTTEVLESLADCMVHPSLRNAFRTAAQDHAHGSRMGEAVRVVPFRASFANAVKTGEQTGQIAERVQELQEPYREEMVRQIGLAVGTLKFVVMALLLPFFIVSTYTSLVGPIFALMEY